VVDSSGKSAAPRLYTLSNAVLVLLATFFSLAIFNGWALDLLGLPINPWPVLALVLLELGAAVLVVVRRRAIAVQFDGVEFIAFVFLVGATTGYSIYPSLPSLVPPTHHYDAVPHTVLPMYIVESQALPHIFAAWAKPYFPPGYPVGTALAVALVSEWLGRSPIQTLHPFISLILGLTAGLVFCFIRRLLPSTPIAFVATLLLFTAWDYFPGFISDRYFSAQLFAQFYALLVFFYLIDYWHAPDLVWVSLILASLATVLFSHPTPLVAPVLAVGLVLALRFLKARKEAIVHGAIIALGLGLVTLFYVLPRLGAWAAQAGYGEAAALTLNSIGIFLPSLGAAGLYLAARAAWRGKFSIVFLLAFGVLAQPVTLFIGHLFFPGFSSYYFEKSIYLLIYPLAMFAALALTQLAERAARHLSARKLQTVLRGIAVAALPVIFFAFPPRPFAPLTGSELEMAQWAKGKFAPDTLAVVSPIREDGYWVHVVVFEEYPSTPSNAAYYNLGSMSYDEWRGNPGAPDYALIRNIEHLSLDSSVSIVHQIGESAVVYKPRAALPSPPTRQYETERRVGDMFDLVGYDLADPVPLGDPITVTLYWRPLRWPADRMSMFIQVLDPSGNVPARTEKEMFQGKFPTQRWPIGKVTADTWKLSLPADILPGAYVLEVAVFSKLTGQRLEVDAPDGTRADRIELGPVHLTVPAPTSVELAAAQKADAWFGEQIALRAFALGRTAVNSGGVVDLDLYWQCISPVEQDYTVFVHLLDSAGHLVAQVDTPPQNGTYPTSAWRSGEMIKDPYHLLIPRGLVPGTYSIEVGLYTAANMKRVPVGGTDHFILPQPIMVK